MRLIQGLLLFTGLLWCGHSLWIFFEPTALTYIGFHIPHMSIIVEIQATFGVFTFMFGVFSLLGAISPKHFMYTAVLLWALLYPAAAVGRFVALLMYGGSFALNAGMPESYHPIMLFVVEIPLSILYLLAYGYMRKEVSSYE